MTSSAQMVGVRSAVGSAPGSMGLRGLFATVGNATAMVVVAVLTFIMLWQIRAMHTEGMAAMERMNDRNVRSMAQAIDSMTGVVARNTAALDGLIQEIRALRAREE